MTRRLFFFALGALIGAPTVKRAVVPQPRKLIFYDIIGPAYRPTWRRPLLDVDVMTAYADTLVKEFRNAPVKVKFDGV